MVSSNNTELSELEKQRQAFIDQNKALLKKLNIDKGQLNLPSFPSPQSGAPKSKKRTAPKRESTQEAPAPRRQSSRLQGLAADSEVAKRKADDLNEAAREAEQAKRRRRMDSFTQDDMFIAGQKLGEDSLIGTDVLTKGVAVPNQRTFGEDEINKTTDKELKALREEMNGLNLWDEWETQIKITPERVYTMAFHPSEAKPLIFAGDKMGHVGIIDGSQKKLKTEDDEEGDEPEPVVTMLKPHARTISSMTIHPLKPTSLYTASYDSSIRELDLEKTLSVEKWGPEDIEIDDGISGLDMAPEDTNTLYWTTLSGNFSIYDLRSPKNTTSTWELSEKKIGGFSLCPSDPNYLATASLDRSIRLWDIRKLSKKSPVSIAEHVSRLSVSHAAFNAAGQVATSSYDDTLKIYDFGSSKLSSLSDIQLRPDPIVRHNCQVGRWVTILRPHWQLNPQSHIQRFCIGNMNRFVDVYSANGDQLAQLGGPGITAVPAVAVFHRSKNWVAGGNASGKVCLWQ